jgi:dienelactone hydrolase
MAEIVLFHPALGLTQGTLAFAHDLRAAGHTVHTPDLYEGATFADVDAGVRHVEQLGFGTVIQRGERAAAGLPSDVVYAGFSLGGLPAQKLAQSRPGAQGLLLFHAFVQPEQLGSSWPHGLKAQIHMMEQDPWLGEDLEAARQFVGRMPEVALFLYPGKGHLFTDKTLTDYDAAAAGQLWDRVISFLDRVTVPAASGRRSSGA